MTTQRKVVVTGLGAVTPIGNTVKTFWENALNGVSGVAKITKFDPVIHSLKSQIAGEVKNFSVENLPYDAKMLKRMDLYAQYALSSATQAIKDSGFLVSNCNLERIGVIVGTGIGGIQTFCQNYDIMKTKGTGRVSPFFIPMFISNIASAFISMGYGFMGPSYAVSSACASGNHAIGDAYLQILNSNADIMLCGGAEAALTPLAFAGFCNMNALSTRNNDPAKASRPFDKNRDGFVMGEGAGVLVLEEYQHAMKRGAKIYAELVGYGQSSDAYHIAAPRPDGYGAQRPIQIALSNAKVSTNNVQYINAHGTSTPEGDIVETKAIIGAFGEHATKLKVNSTKSMTGHLLGGAGGIEAIATVMSIYNQRIHPTINLDEPDPLCTLDYTPNKAIDLPIEYGLSNSFGFGGHNACLLFKRFQ